MTPAIERRVKHILSEHPRWGVSVYRIPDAGPFDGDYMLEIFEEGNPVGKVCRFWYFVDDQARTVNIVNVHHQDFGWM